jgi:hypothetical protein
MNQRRAKFWVWWLLPVLAARALLPVGLMPQLSQGEFKLTLCSAGFAKVTDTSSPAHSDGASHVSVCPFALSAGAALGAAAVINITEHGLNEVHQSFIQSQHFTEKFFRSNRVRGPPAFS